MFAIYRNSYLQAQSSSVNPRIINRCVDLARIEPIVADSSYFEPPFYRLTSEQPDIPIENVDPTRRPVAFGRWDLPKLRREIHDNEDNMVEIAALLSICDLVHDPERGYEAIQLKFPDRLADKLLDPLPPVRESTVLALQILAEYYDGREAIVSNYTVMENLYLCLGDEQISVRLKVAGCFEMLARSWMTADVLVDGGLVQTLLDILQRDELWSIMELHLETLKSLMYDCGKCIALKEGGFRVFMHLLDHDSSVIVGKALDCLAILASTRKGKKIAIQKNLLKILNKFLHYGDTSTITSAARVMMFCTVKTRAKLLAAEIQGLPKRLVKLVTNPLNATLQMFAMKTLTNICEHPKVRKEVRERFLDELLNLQVMKDNEVYKKTLLQVICWVPEKWD